MGEDTCKWYSDKGQNSKNIKRSYSSTKNEQTIGFKNGQRIYRDTFLREIYRWPTDIWKNGYMLIITSYWENANQNYNEIPPHTC